MTFDTLLHLHEDATQQRFYHERHWPYIGTPRKVNIEGVAQESVDSAIEEIKRIGLHSRIMEPSSYSPEPSRTLEIYGMPIGMDLPLEWIRLLATESRITQPSS